MLRSSAAAVSSSAHRLPARAPSSALANTPDAVCTACRDGRAPTFGVPPCCRTAASARCCASSAPTQVPRRTALPVLFPCVRRNRHHRAVLYDIYMCMINSSAQQPCQDGLRTQDRGQCATWLGLLVVGGRGWKISAPGSTPPAIRTMGLQRAFVQCTVCMAQRRHGALRAHRTLQARYRMHIASSCIDADHSCRRRRCVTRVFVLVPARHRGLVIRGTDGRSCGASCAAGIHRRGYRGPRALAGSRFCDLSVDLHRSFAVMAEYSEQQPYVEQPVEQPNAQPKVEEVYQPNGEVPVEQQQVLSPPQQQQQQQPNVAPAAAPAGGRHDTTLTPGKVFIGGLNTNTTKETLQEYCAAWRAPSSLPEPWQQHSRLRELTITDCPSSSCKCLLRHLPPSDLGSMHCGRAPILAC